MDKLQFRVLYRQFLFRVFDPEVLSAQAQGNASTLLGQFAALLVFVSAILSFVAILSNPDAPWSRGLVGLVVTMILQHFLIATTMLVVGLFAVLSWDATFPDRRDMFVLAPLPVRTRTMFLAKVSAVAASLGLTIVLLHSVMGLIWPLVFVARTEPATFPALTFDATPAPVAARDLKAVMDRDLLQTLTSGTIAPGKGMGLAIGVWQRGERRVFTYGAAKPDILSTAGDMLTHLEAQLHAGNPGGEQIALTWGYSADTGTYWHNAATSGFTSHAFFNPRMDSAVVVLMNSGPNWLLSADLIAEHIRQRLPGEPAISLDTVLVPASAGFSGLLRSFAAYWFTMLAAGVFIYGAVLGTQGLAALALPRRLFLRLSGYLQLAVIGLMVVVYFLQPGFWSLQDLLFGSIGRVIQWLPSYWFLALYQQLNGSMHPALAPLARHAWIGLAVVVFGTALTYTLSYWRTLSKIVEEPDIAPSPPRWRWLPRFGTQAQTAIAQFSVRTMARSKQHRLILGFYLGIGLAFTSLLLKGSQNVVNSPWRERSMVLWAGSIMIIVLAAVGTRVAFALPVDLRANWIFRVTGLHGGPETLAASRRALLLLSVVPVWIVTAVVCMALWPELPNVAHLILLGCLGMILADVCLLYVRKIPFTCSYLPGKSRFHMAFLGALGVLMVGSKAARLERDALRETSSMAMIVALLIVAWVCIRRITVGLSERGEQELLFEEEAPPAVLELGLRRDGVMVIAPPEEQ